MESRQTRVFDALIAPALGRLFGLACRLAGNVADAEDLVQDTCLKACEKLELLEAAQHPERWLLRVLYNHFVDGTRRRERSPVAVLRNGADVAALAEAAAGDADPGDARDDERAFACALASLSPSHRAILSLRAEGYALGEIEAITGIGRDVLRARLQRARASLARHLEEQASEGGSHARLGSGR